HSLMSRLQFVDGTMMKLNLALLMAASFLPYPTRLMSEAIRDTEAERVAVVFYGLTLVVKSLLVHSMWRTAMLHTAMPAPGVTVAELRAAARASSPSIGLYPVMAVGAWVSPRAAAFGYLVVAVLVVARVCGRTGPMAEPVAAE